MLTTSSSRALLITCLAVVAVLLAALWQQRTDLAQLRQDYARLAAQYQKLQQTLTQQRTARAPAVAAVAAPAQPARPPVPEGPNRLVLAGVAVKPVAGGLLATLQFKPAKAGPLEDVMLAVQLPKNAAAKIGDLDSQGAYSHTSKRVLHGGQFAIFQGTLKDVSAIQVDVALSGPATLDVRGTCGIVPFLVDVTPTGATVHGN